MRVTALAGGTGAAKFLRGLTSVIAPEQVTVIGNTGDDALIWGLHVSPDLDTVIYALAGLLDERKGWGIRGDSFRCLAAMATLGRETWFNLGDRDLATHLFRTERLRTGESLSQVTDAQRAPEGWLGFQEFFVREKARPEVLDVAYAGADLARPAPGVLEAIETATAILVCPSNPITSIGPILAVPGIVDALGAARGEILAISPIVGDAPVSGPAGKLMAARGLSVSATGVARFYRPWLDTLVLDCRDEALLSSLQDLGVTPVLANTLMTDREKAEALARRVLELLT